jgi:hypothetical protein
MALNAQLATSAFAITPSDTTRINASAVYAGAAGTVIIEPVGNPGSAITFTVPAGGYVLCQCSRVMAASTATGLVGLS